LPPYSPFLNPIEEVFAQWKNFISGARNENENDLNKSIVSGFNSITEGQVKNYVRHMRIYLRKCIERNVILS
jgi:transposase